MDYRVSAIGHRLSGAYPLDPVREIRVICGYLCSGLLLESITLRCSRNPMTRESLAPLLRGIGSSLILAGAIIGFVVARQEMRISRTHRQSQSQVALSGKDSPGVSKNNEEANDESVAERLVENPWFELLGFLGMAGVSSSFYVEYLARRTKRI